MRRSNTKDTGHERLKTKKEESTRLSDTGLVVELEHLKTKMRLIDEKFASVRGVPTSLIFLIFFLCLVLSQQNRQYPFPQILVCAKDGMSEGAPVRN
jgi:hypothetical protein